MSPQLPPAVASSDEPEVHILDWTVPFTHGEREHELTGDLRWVDQGPWWPWLLGALLVTTPALVGLRRRDRDAALAAVGQRTSPWRPLLRPAAAAVAAVALLNTIHFVDELLAWPAPTLDVLFGVFHTALFVGVGLGGAALAWRGREGPLLSLGIASGAVLFHQGLLQVRILTSSQLPTIWPDVLLRGAVAASIAQALWVAIVITAARRRERGIAGGPPMHSAPPAAGKDDQNRQPQKELI
jgi:hypothetical protein